MKKWEVYVTERREYSVRYVVEAASKKKALEKAEAGETVEETDIRCDGVTGREVTCLYGGVLNKGKRR